jgi:hypothetical protein
MFRRQHIERDVSSSDWSWLRRWQDWWERCVREFVWILLVCGSVLLISGPVRGRWTDPLIEAGVAHVEGWVLDHLLAMGISSLVARQVAVFCLMVLALMILVILLAIWLDKASQLTQYSYNSCIDSQLHQLTLRRSVVATGLPLTFGLAIALNGSGGLYAVALFSLLFIFVRLTLGETCDVLISPRHRQSDPEPRRS